MEDQAARAAKRVRKMSDHSLLDWLEGALTGMYHHLDEYRKSEEVAHIGEMMIADVTLGAVLTEIRLRHEARRQEGFTE